MDTFFHRVRSCLRLFSERIHKPLQPFPPLLIIWKLCPVNLLTYFAICHIPACGLRPEIPGCHRAGCRHRHPVVLLHSACQSWKLPAGNTKHLLPAVSLYTAQTVRIKHHAASIRTVHKIISILLFLYMFQLANSMLCLICHFF